ncbi:MAG: hypothetical protein JWQ35_2752 [Bacteriovoracaceae bacterium]|nr:hypothetical protein [Bacteriovoracaceae bacterium]
MKKLALLFSFIFPAITTASAIPDLSQLKWKEIEDQDGIKTFEADVPGFSRPAFRAEAIIESEISKVVSAITDTNRRQEWTPNLKVSKIIQPISKVEWVEYWQMTAPLVDDRDLVFSTGFDFDWSKKRLIVPFHSVDSPSSPKTKNVLAIVNAGSYVLWPTENKSGTNIIYECLFDFGGSVPGWFASSFQRSNPRKVLQGLRKQVNKSDIVSSPKIHLLFEDKVKKLADIF